MAITEADILRLRDQKKRDWMLLRSERHFHLVRVDSSLTEQKYQRLMKRYPCGVRAFMELGIPVTALSRDKCTHAIFGGTKEGELLTLWFSGDIRRFTLGADYSREWLADFFSTQQHRWDIPEVPEGPDAETTRILGWSLNILAFGLLVFALFGRGFPRDWLRWLTLVVFAVSVGLCIRWPGRFLADDGRRIGTKRVFRAGMEFPVFVLPMAMALDVFERFTYRDWLMLVLLGAVVGLLIGAVLLWRSREYRSGGLGLLLGLIILSGGLVAQVNQLLDLAPTTAYTLTVEDTERHSSGRGGTRYYCHVTMPDGEQEQFSIPWSRYKELEPGDPITIFAHEGALGLEYLSIDWNE